MNEKADTVFSGFRDRRRPASRAASGIEHLDERLNETTRKAPLRRTVHGCGVGRVALMLASDYASAITGEVLYVDAGFHIEGMAFSLNAGAGGTWSGAVRITAASIPSGPTDGRPARLRHSARLAGAGLKHGATSTGGARRREYRELLGRWREIRSSATRL